MIDVNSEQQYDAFCAVVGFSWDNLKNTPGVLEDILKKFRLDPTLAEAPTPDLPGYDGFACTAHLTLMGIDKLSTGAEDPNIREFVEKELRMPWADAQQFMADLKEMMSIIVNGWPNDQETFDLSQMVAVAVPILGQIAVQIVEQIKAEGQVGDGIEQAFQGGNFQAN